MALNLEIDAVVECSHFHDIHSANPGSWKVWSNCRKQMTMGCPAPDEISVKQLLQWRLRKHSKDGEEILQVLEEQGVCCEIESLGNIIEAASTRLHKPGCLSKDNTIGHANMERRNPMDHNSRVLPAGKLEILRVGAIAFCSFFVSHINSIPGVRHSTFWAGQSTTPVPFSSSYKTKTIKDL